MFKHIHDFQNTSFNIFIATSYILYICIVLGLTATAPQYLETLVYYIKIYISLFLLYRFNLFRDVKFTDLDRKVAFSAGLFLFSTTIVKTILENYLQQINNQYKLKSSKCGRWLYLYNSINTEYRHYV